APALAGAQLSAREGSAAKAGGESPSAGALPRWLSVGGQLRARAEAYRNGGFRPDNSDQYLLTRVLLSARVHPTRATSLFVEGMDARGPWKNKTPIGAPFRDHADLRQLYLQLGGDNSANMIRGGRLELAFGDGRLVGSLPWANTARTFDGARAAFGGKGYRVDAFAASVVKVEQDKFDKNVPGNNFYGLYSSFTRLAPKLGLEPFFFWRRQSGLTTELAAPGAMNFGTVGLRAIGKLPSNVDYDTQMAAQSGKLGDESIRAWAGHWLLGYTVAKVSLTPRLFAEYNQASGDENPTDNKKGTFDQLYPTGHDKYGLTDLVGWQNMKQLRTGLELAISKTWSATARYNRYWLSDAHDALYNGGGGVLARSATGVAGTDVGREVDLIASGKLRPGLGFSAGLGYFIPGTFLKNTTPGKPYTYPYAMVTYDF
ncbi:MAG TPA: alginate export family protein, partial [Gemmatimonadaceae bacterium]|nr:alginate export family protein [Gemmatimonadaceae bacterium]